MRKKAETVWTHIRLRAETKALLDQFVSSLYTALEQGKIVTPHRHLLSVTHDDAVRFLVEREMRKRERAKASKKRRKKAPGKADITS